MVRSSRELVGSGEWPGRVSTTHSASIAMPTMETVFAARNLANLSPVKPFFAVAAASVAATFLVCGLKYV